MTYTATREYIEELRARIERIMYLRDTRGWDWRRIKKAEGSDAQVIYELRKKGIGAENGRF